MKSYFAAAVIGAAAFPVLILIPAQVFLTLRAKNTLFKFLPMLLCLLLFLAALLLPGQGIHRLVAGLYGVLLLILCGAGWVIADSIKKSSRK